MSLSFELGESSTGYPQYTWSIDLNGLSPKALTTAAQYLMTNVDGVFEYAATLDEEAMWPIVFKLEDAILSESSFWQLVFDNCDNGYQLLIAYIEKICLLSSKREYEHYLLLSDEYHYMGSYAFNRYWDHIFEIAYPDHTELELTYKAFFEFLTYNDLDNEFSQDRYITKVLEEYQHLLNEDTTVRLLCLRLGNGQCAEKSFDFLDKILAPLYRKGRLKAVIDYLAENDLSHTNYVRGLASFYLTLCAIYYGSNMKLTNEVMDYVKQMLDVELSETFPHQMNKINQMRELADIKIKYFTSQKRYYDSSFHVYDTEQKTWLSYDEIDEQDLIEHSTFQ